MLPGASYGRVFHTASAAGVSLSSASSLIVPVRTVIIRAIYSMIPDQVMMLQLYYALI